MNADALRVIKDYVKAAWPEAGPVQPNRLGEYNIYRTLNGVTQRCWLFRGADGEIFAVLAFGFDGLPTDQVTYIRLRGSKPPLAGLDERGIADHLIGLSRPLSSPKSIRRVTLSEMERRSELFSGRVPFSHLAVAYMLAGSAMGQRITVRWLTALRIRLMALAEGWPETEIVPAEQGRPGEQTKRTLEPRLYWVAIHLLAKERDQLIANLSTQEGDRPG